MDRTTRIAALGLGATFLAATAACSSGDGSSSRGMMGTGSDTSYHYARLTCSAPSSLSGSVVTVMLADMGMTHMMGGTAPMGAHMMLRATPTTVAAGQVTFVAQNMGWRTHELVVLPLPTGAQPGQRVPAADGKIDETGSLGEASANCAAGAGDGIPAGSVGWVTVTLTAGRYELVCNLPNHYADGMRQELDVSNG